LDDVFSELDQRRSEHLLKFVGELSQTFVTSTSPQFFEHAIPFGDENRKFIIESGAVAGYTAGHHPGQNPGHKHGVAA
jgi:recombinational DNA repair ATPase RecF